MLLSDLEGRVHGQMKVIFDLLWDMVSGNVPKMKNFTSEEVKQLFLGKDVEGVKSPFLLLTKDMLIKPLPLMTLVTTDNERFRRRQMVVHHTFETINKMLEILEIESESIELGDIVF